MFVDKLYTITKSNADKIETMIMDCNVNYLTLLILFFGSFSHSVDFVFFSPIDNCNGATIYIQEHNIICHNKQCTCVQVSIYSIG